MHNALVVTAICKLQAIQPIHCRSNQHQQSQVCGPAAIQNLKQWEFHSKLRERIWGLGRKLSQKRSEKGRHLSGSAMQQGRACTDPDPPAAPKLDSSSLDKSCCSELVSRITSGGYLGSIPAATFVGGM